MSTNVNSPYPAPINQSNSRPSIEEESVDFAQYWHIVKHYKISIFSLTLIGLIIGILTALVTTPVYKAETKLIADPRQPNFDNRNQANTALISLFYETQYEIIGSRNIALKTVDKLNLVARHKSGQATQIKSAEQALIPEPSDEVLRTNLANNIQSKLNVKGGKQSQIIRISYEDVDPQLAADITNAIADSYVEFGLESRLSSAKQTSAWLNEQLQDLKANLRESEDALLTFQRKQGMVDTSQQEHLSTTRLSTLTTELIRAQTKHSETAIRYKQIRHKHQNNDYASLNSILNNHTVQIQEQEVTKLSRSVQELSERYGEKHPKMIAARADLHETKQNLKTEIDKAVDSVRKEYQATLDLEKKLNALIKKEKKDLGAIKGSSFELARLEREAINNQKLYESFLIRFQQANVSEQYDASNIHIIDIASIPVKPYKPNKPRFIIIALGFGLFIGILLAFLREHLDNTFKTTKDLEDKLKLPVLGAIPAIKSVKNAITPERQVMSDPRSQFSESINNIRTGLLFSNIIPPPKTILITSATTLEGKSTLAINLAASLSQLDRTLFLEVDLRKPSVAEYVEIAPFPGIIDQILYKKSILKEAITKVGDENSQFYVMPAGNSSPNPLELLSSDYFKHQLEELKKTFTYIILDGPPVLAVSDAIVVGQLVDSVIIVAKAGSTKTQMTQEATHRLSKANIKVTGTVLCQTDEK